MYEDRLSCRSNERNVHPTHEGVWLQKDAQFRASALRPADSGTNMLQQ